MKLVRTCACCNENCHQKAKRLTELVEDYVRDKSEIGRLLGLGDGYELVHEWHKQTLIEIRNALRSDTPAYEQLNRIQKALGMFQKRTEVETRHEYKADEKYPWFCGKCGYPPDHPIMHLPNTQDDRTRASDDQS